MLPSTVGKRRQSIKVLFKNLVKSSKIGSGKAKLVLIMAMANNKAGLSAQGERGEHIRTHKVEMGIMNKLKLYDTTTEKPKRGLRGRCGKAIKPHPSHISRIKRTKKTDKRT